MDGVFENNVLETSVSAGLGAFVLAAVPGFRRFADALSVGKPCHYTIKAVDVVGRPTGAYESGFGTYSAANTLARTVVVESSSANQPVDFAAGSKTVVMTSLAPNTVRAREDWQNALGLSFAGAVAYCAASTPPAGWLKCNGAQVSRATYARLFGTIGTYYGAGDGTNTFNLPDLRGEFIRSWDDGRTLDNGRGFASVQGSQNLSHAHGVADPGHAHSVYDPSHAHGAWTEVNGAHDHAGIQIPLNMGDSDRGGASSVFSIDSQRSLPYDGNHQHAVGIHAAYTGVAIYGSGTGIGIHADGGAEARPRNIALLAVIKF